MTFSLLYVSPVFTVNAQQFSKVTPEEIAEKALADFKVSDSEVDYSIVALESEQPKIGAYNVVEEEKEYAVRVDTVEGNQVKSDLYIPYMETDNGDLMNIFALAAGKEWILSNTDKEILNGLTVKITLYGTRFTLTNNVTDIVYYWRSISSQAIWTGTGSGTISRMEVGVDIHGDLYNYNNSTGKLGSRIETGYSWYLESRNITNPYKNTYYSTSTLLGSNSGRAIDLQPSPLYEISGVCFFSYKNSKGNIVSNKILVAFNKLS